MNSLFSKKWFKLILIIGGVILIVFGLYQILGPSKKVSKDFINKFNEVSDLAEDITKTSALDLTGLEEKETAGDFTAVLEIIKGALDKNTQTSDKIEALISKTTELKELAQKISDSVGRESALKVTDLLEQNNSLGKQYINIQKQILEIINDYYQKKEKGHEIPILQDELNNLSNQAAQINQQLQGISSQYTIALEELAKNAGITLKKK